MSRVKGAVVDGANDAERIILVQPGNVLSVALDE